MAQLAAYVTEALLTEPGEIEKHYTSEGITQRVLATLRNVKGPAVPITPDTLAPLDHFLAGR